MGPLWTGPANYWDVAAQLSVSLTEAVLLFLLQKWCEKRTPIWEEKNKQDKTRFVPIHYLGNTIVSS